jgi:hypothetical protein
MMSPTQRSLALLGERGERWATLRLTWLWHLTQFENFAGEWPTGRAAVQPLRRRAFGED